MATKSPQRKTTRSKTTRKPRVATASKNTSSSTAAPQGHHLASWLLMWSMFACALIVSIAALTQVDWKWLTAYAYEQTHKEEIAQDLLIQALDKATCEMAANATAASTSTCAALGFTAPALSTSTATTTAN